MKLSFALTMTAVIVGILWLEYGFGAALLATLLAVIVFICTAVEVEDAQSRIDRILADEHTQTQRGTTR